MGRRTSTTTSSSSQSDVWQQPGGGVINSDAINAGGLPNDPEIAPEMAPLTATNLGDSQASPSISAGFTNGSTIIAEEESDYDMCFGCEDAQEDGYILVELEPAPKARGVPSRISNKGQEASKM